MRNKSTMPRGLSSCRYLLLFLTCLAPASLTGQNLELLGNYRIAVLTGIDAPATVQGLYRGLNIAKGELQERYTIEIDFERIALPAQVSASNIPPQLQRLLDAPPDAVIVVATAFGSPSNWETVLNEAGIPLISIHASADDPLSHEHIVANEFAAGRLAAEQLLQAMRRSGTIAILTASGTPELEARLQGALAALGNRQAYVLLPTEPNPHAAHAILRKTVAEDRDRRIRGWLFLDDWAFRGMVEPIWDASRAPAVSIMNHPSTTAALRSGQLAGIVIQPWQDWGYEALYRLTYQIHDRAGEREHLTTFPPKWYPRSESTTLESLWSSWLLE
jgi:ABC-type sugar transport system substrate-binding protein